MTWSCFRETLWEENWQMRFNPTKCVQQKVANSQNRLPASCPHLLVSNLASIVCAGAIGETGASSAPYYKKSNFRMTIAAICLRKLYIQVRHNKAEIVQIISFVFFCTIKGNLQPRRSGHDGQTCPAIRQVRPSPSGKLRLEELTCLISCLLMFSLIVLCTRLI